MRISPEVVRSNILAVRESIINTALSAGRDPAAVKLLVVTKQQTIENCLSVIAAGVKYLGENYVEEALPKIQALSESEMNIKVEWHMIGHIQSRKSAKIVDHFNYVHSLDSVKLAQKLNQFADLQKIKLPVLLEINTSGEIAKSGFPLAEGGRWEALVPEILQIAELPYLDIKGLMTIPPLFDDPEKSMPYYVILRKLQEYLNRKIPNVNWSELSMGMSADYKVAIQEGATWIRIGQAILGPRM